MIPRFREIQLSWLRWISNRIATYSYGIYLSHQFAIWTAFGVLASHSLAVKIPVLVAMLVALPVLLYHAIEKPMIGVGGRLAARFSEQAPTRGTVLPVQANESATSKLNLGEEVAP